MCSTCDIKNYKKSGDMQGTLIMSLGTSEEIMMCYDENSKKYFISNGDAKTNFMIYRCPTCGRKLF